MSPNGIILVVSEPAHPIEPLMAPLYASESYQVHHADSTEAALKRAQSLDSDLVVVMAHTKGGNHERFYADLRALPGHADDPILAVVPLGDEQARANAIEAGADDVLGSPFRPAVLLSRVRTMVRLSLCRRVYPLQTPTGTHEDRTPAIQAQRSELAQKLKKALTQDELLVLYQAKVDASTGSVVGAEAFVRWRVPGSGLVPPGQFMSVAEEEGLILDIGEWITDDVCRQLAAWSRLGLSLVPVSINVSQRQFRQQALDRVCQNALDRHHISPALLGLELTEAMLTAQPELAISRLKGLRDLGLHVALDDFGTGYSSLAWLPRFALTSLKIDQSFVQGSQKHSGDAAVVAAVIHIAHALGLKATAEGVETPDQAEFLREHGCDELQGYLFSRPVLPEAFAQMLARPAAFAAQAQITPQRLMKFGVN